MGDTLGMVVMHRPGRVRGVNHCFQVGQMDGVDMELVILSQAESG